METTNSKEFSLSDEINLLFFRVEPIRISIWQDESAEEFLDNTIDYFSIMKQFRHSLFSFFNQPRIKEAQIRVKFIRFHTFGKCLEEF